MLRSSRRCGPCKAIAPKLDTLSGTLEGKVKFIKVDVDKLGGLAQKKQVSAMPTFHVYVQETTDGQKKSVLKKSVVGANLPALTAAIDQYVREVAAAPAAASV